LMRIDVLTLFPGMFDGVFNESILKRAREIGAVQLNVVNFRDFSDDRHKSVDDYPFGGGAGMVLKPQPIYDAVSAIEKNSDSKPKVILLCPQGRRFNQKMAESFAKENHLLFICGHYEGFDERIRFLADEELSIGDFVLTGGELAAMVVIDSIVRLLPGVLGNEDSPVQDSFSTGLLEYPQYTRPRDFRGMKVPDVLLSGDHKKIDEWRKKEALRRTFLRRPDLLERYPLSEQEKQWLEDFKKES